MHFIKSTGVKVWLDDDRDPKDHFIQKEFGADGDEVWIKTAQDTIALLMQGHVASISLDHDLGVGDNGYTVAKFIEEGAYNGTLPRLTWHLHTANLVGKRYMAQALHNADKYWSNNENAR